MFKVVLVLKSLAIRLRECECQIVLHKDKQNFTLCPKVTVLHGNCQINETKEFYVNPEDCKVTLLIYLSQGAGKHYGGEVNLDVMEWEENVIHTVLTRVANSPDKNSSLNYQFYYFRDPTISDRRPIFLSEERHRPEYNIIQSSNQQLNREKRKLEEEVYAWHKRNEALENGRQNMVSDIHQRQQDHRFMMGSCQQSINLYSEELERQRQTKEGLLKLAQEHGLCRNNQTHRD